MKKIALFLALAVASSAAAGEPTKVAKSQVGPTFQSDVSRYAGELAEWKAHMAKVAADKAAGVPKDKAFSPYPPPLAPPLVAGAVDETGKPNYQIVDDGPTPDEVLAAKKQKLFDQISLAEHQATIKILPYGKVRLMNERASAIRMGDAVALKGAQDVYSAAMNAMLATRFKRDSVKAAIAQRVATQSIVSKVISGPASATPDETAQIATLDTQDQQQTAAVEAARAAVADPQAAKAKARSAADHAFMTDYEARQAKIAAIHHWAAQATSDVDDLTSANIDAWKMTPLPN